jgi:hypothetical protein
MPARAPYIPRPQVEFDQWAGNFAKTVAEDPDRYALTQSDAEEITGVVEKWRKAFQPVTCKETKTQCTVAEKNGAFKAALNTLRCFAQQITHCPDVSEGDRTALGVNPGKLKWTRIAVADSHPCLAVVKAESLRLTIRFLDNLMAKQAKPHGVSSCQVFYALADRDERITSHAALTTQHTATRSRFFIDFPGSAGGRQCFMAGYWLMRNGKRGAWGPIMSFTVPTGG